MSLHFPTSVTKKELKTVLECSYKTLSLLMSDEVKARLDWSKKRKFFTSTVVVIFDDLGIDVDITVEGGTEPYEFNWDNGAETEDLTGVPAGEYVCLVTDANGCITTFGPFVVKSFSSVENLDGLVGFDVYPNPAEAFINVDLEFESALEFNVTIYNKLGESLHAFRNNARSYSDRLEVSDYVAGIYLLVITTDKGSITKKIMIQ